MADSIQNGVFTQPYTEKMNFGEFITNLQSDRVYYCQQQNDCFRTDQYESIQDDVAEFEWLKNTLGAPDAQNIWIGDNRSITSTHKDHYENIYAVIRGEKHFILYPPTDLPYLYQRVYPSGRYDSEHVIHCDDPETLVPWISVDPLKPDYERFPLFKHATPYRVTLKQGDILYLPSLWFHFVSQRVDEREKIMISVNSWYDMVYGPMYNSYKFVESCVERATKEEVRPSREVVDPLAEKD